MKEEEEDAELAAAAAGAGDRHSQDLTDSQPVVPMKVQYNTIQY